MARILLAIHNVHGEPLSGAARSMRIIARWLSQAGHEVGVLSTARFESTPSGDLSTHLAGMGIEIGWRDPEVACPEGHYVEDGVRVRVLATTRNDMAHPDAAEDSRYLEVFDRLLREDQPQIVMSYGAHRVLHEALRRARLTGARTVFSVRAKGYEQSGWYRHADHVLTTNAYMVRYLDRHAGVAATGIASPIDWAETLGTEETRGFVTFVNPTLAKGLALFARLAYMLGRRRPDIPILVVRSTGDPGVLARIPGLDLARYEQILVSPPLARPADIFSLTRILLAPSVLAEPFARVAAEALINGVPPIVSDRGGLFETVDDGGIVLPLPEWMTPDTRRVPEEAEVEPWFAAVTRLWDDDQAYAAASAAARAAGVRLYGEERLRAAYDRWFRRIAK